MRCLLSRKGSLARVALGGATIALALAGCGSRDCTLVGFQSGVQMQVPSRLWGVAEFCINEQCLRNDLDGTGFIPVGDEPATYSFRLRVVSPGGEEIVREGTVETRRYEINGSGCDPITANAVVRVGDDGEVSVGTP